MEYQLGAALLQDYLHMGANFHVSILSVANDFTLQFYRNFVPISLLVTLELVHFFHAIFMSNDAMMYDYDQDFP